MELKKFRKQNSEEGPPTSSDAISHMSKYLFG